MVKLPPTVPLAALQFGAAFAAALPPGVVNVLAAPGIELSHALVTHPGIDVISLTDYDPEPVEPAAEGNALICCSRPTSTVVLDL